MYKDKSIICLVLARGGSKGIKNKNFIKIQGKPLIEYSFDQIKKSKYIDEFLLSSDSNKIINIAKKNKIEAPFKRPAYLASDNSKSEESILHAISYLEKNKKKFDFILLIEPTSPLRDFDDIDGIIKFTIDNNYFSAVSICDVSTCHPNFMYSLNKNKIKKAFNSDNFKSKPRQYLSKYYFLEGSLYFSSIKFFKKNKSFISQKTGGYILPKWKSLEIDEPIDIVIFESYIKNLKNLKKFKNEK